MTDPALDQQPPQWEPANETERALAKALTDGDQQAFFGIIAAAELYLPQVGQEETGEQTFITAELFGQTVLVVYTSLEGLTASVAGVADAYTVTTYPELLERWPQPQWRLAVNPGYPIDAYLPVEEVGAAAKGDVKLPTAAEVIVAGFAEDEQATQVFDTDTVLRDAAERNDPGTYIDTLLDSTVVVPTAHAVEDPEQLLDQQDWWRPAGTEQEPVLEVFTSEEAFFAAFPMARTDPATGWVHSVTMPFVLLLGVWPEGTALAVNPRTDFGIELPAQDVQALLLWEPEDPAAGTTTTTHDSDETWVHGGL